jgi:hypothetical protein
VDGHCWEEDVDGFMRAMVLSMWVDQSGSPSSIVSWYVRVLGVVVGVWVLSGTGSEVSEAGFCSVELALAN